MSSPCVMILGGSFDPVHAGHVGLVRYCSALLQPDALRLVPAGQPWQKAPLGASAPHRVAMLRLAFADCALPFQIDEQEITRAGPSYTIDTVRALRAELGPEASLVLALGADQLHNLPTWHSWQQLFDYVNLCVVARPGYLTDKHELAPAIAREIARRAASAKQIRTTPCGLIYVATNFAFTVSATKIRQALQAGQTTKLDLPDAVLDYIKQHHLYQS